MSERESERKRERSEGERKRENETERQSSSQPGGGQTGRLRAFSFRLSPFSLLPPFAFASFSCCFPSRAGPAVPRTAPRRAVPSQNHLCAWPKPPAVGLASGPLFSSPRSRSFFFLTILLLLHLLLLLLLRPGASEGPLFLSLSISHTHRLIWARLDLRSTRPLNLSYAPHTVHDDKILYPRERWLDLSLRALRNTLVIGLL